MLRHRGEPRPWVVWIHGAEQGGTADLFAFRARHLHEELGLNVALPVLPQHGPRRDLGKAWPGFDLLGNIATMMRAVSDVRLGASAGSADQQPTSTSVVGMSLGGPVAALTAGLDDRVDSVVAMVPMLDAHATIAHHMRRTGAPRPRARRHCSPTRPSPPAARSSTRSPSSRTPLPTAGSSSPPSATG